MTMVHTPEQTLLAGRDLPYNMRPHITKQNNNNTFAYKMDGMVTKYNATVHFANTVVYINNGVKSSLDGNDLPQ